MSCHSTFGASVYLVVVGDPVMALDLRQGVAELDPAGTVVVATDLATAASLLDTSARLVLALIECGPSELETSVIGNILDASGGAAVLLGDAAESATRDPRYPVLCTPIFADDLRAVLLEQLSAAGQAGWMLCATAK